MATKSKLEKAISERSESLNPAQRELVMSQFADWKRNKARIAQIEDILGTRRRAASGAFVEHRPELVNERAQLIDVNGRIAARLFEQLSEDE